MSKYCGNCGAELADSASVCGYCGMPFQKKSLIQNIENITGISINPNEETVNKIKKFAKPAAIVVAAIVVLVVIISAISSNSGYKGALNKYFKGVQELDVEVVDSLTADLDMIGYDADEREELLYDAIESVMEEYEDDYGKDVKLKAKILDATVWDLDDVKLRKFVKNYEDNEDYDATAIKKAVELEIELTIKGDRRKDTDIEHDFWMIKENGKWKVTYVEL